MRSHAFSPQENVYLHQSSKGKWAKERSEESCTKMMDTATPSTSLSVTPAPVPQPSSCSASLIIATAGEQLNTNYQTHELPGVDESSDSSSTILVHPLLARIKMLESENMHLEQRHINERTHFRIEDIQHNDRLVSQYTGFASFVAFLWLAIEH